MCFFIGWFEPLESISKMRIELLNEATALVLIYILFCFTDFMSDVEVRSQVGIVYICTGLGNVAVHLVLMWLNSCINIKRSCRRRYLRK